MASDDIVLMTAPLNDYANAAFSKFGELVVAPDNSEKTLSELITRAVALAVRGIPPITAKIINSAPKLRVIGRTGVGYSNVDIEAATQRGIPVIFTPGAGARAVAEAAVALMLGLSKDFFYWQAQMQKQNWNSRIEHQSGDLEGAVLGIVGCGRIGQELIKLSTPFDMQILVFDPFLKEGLLPSHVKIVELDYLLRNADFISLHCPETPESKGLINKSSLEKMKQGAYLINLARGSVIESLDLLEEALNSGKLAGVGLDVFEPEPPDLTHPIFKNPRCIAAPHSLGATRGAMARITQWMTDDMVAVLEGRKPRFVANPKALEK